MRKILFLTLVIICGVAFSDGWAKRPKKNQPTQELTAAERDSLIKALEEMKRDEAEYVVRPSIYIHNYSAEDLRDDGLISYVPCGKEANDDDEYYREFGATSGCWTIEGAKWNALYDAWKNLEKRLAMPKLSDNVHYDIYCEKQSIGLAHSYSAYVVLQVKKIDVFEWINDTLPDMPYFSKSYDTDAYYGGWGMGQGETEEVAMRIAQWNAINHVENKSKEDVHVADIERTFQQISQDSNGEYTCYMAIHVPKKNESDSLKNDIQILLMDSVQRDSLRQVFKEKFDSLLNVQEPQLRNNINGVSR